MKKIIMLVMVIIVIFVGTSIEREKVETLDDKNSRDLITYNMNINPDDLKLIYIDNRREKDLLVTLFEGLVKENENGQITPALAREFNVSEDGLQYTFTLRDDIRYSNGEKIVAKDFKEFFKAFIGDKQNIYAKELDCIFGVKAFREGTGNFSDVAIVDNGDDVLSIRLNYRCPYFINILTNPVYTLRDYKDLDEYKDKYTSIRFTGPFIIKEANDEELVVKRNDSYYDSDNVTDENIKISFNESAEKSLAIFESSNKDYFKNIDIMLDVPSNELLRLAKDGVVKSFKGVSKYYLNFNDNDKSLGSDLNFRNSINSALSKEYYSQIISKELLSPAIEYVEKSSAVETVFSSYGHTEKAMAYLKELGINENSIIKIAYIKNNLNKRVIEELCYDLEKELSINIEAKGYTDVELKDVIKKNEYDVLLQELEFKYRYPGEYYESFSKLSEANIIGYYDTQYEELLNRARYEMNENKRNEIYEECEAIIKRKLNSIPLYDVNIPICVKKDISKVYVTTGGNIRLEKVERVP
ncbi:MAG: ABC transporter substrate-binding protein [Clostridium sp.]|uniref:ABC transporter substrate-binding protein n=1 Tax=Clostridium sp. TaxID=1506 RepID=UPI00302E0E0B